MEDTTAFIPKEIVITCGLFLVILVIGTFAFDLYTRGEQTLVLTGATVAENQEFNTTNSITGGVIGITTHAMSDDTTKKRVEDAQIGVYAIKPSFTLEDDKDIVDTYDTLQEEIRVFHTDVMDCTATKERDDCIATILQAYDGWLPQEACETPQEALLYDFTEMFSSCLLSEDDVCVCEQQWDISPYYDAGEYTITVFQDETGVLFSSEQLASSEEHTIETTIEGLVLQIYGVDVVSDAYTLVINSNSLEGNFLIMKQSNELLMYKQYHHLSVEEDLPTGVDACTMPKDTVEKFCVQSDKTVHIYDPYEDGVIEQPLVYVFALDFSE